MAPLFMLKAADFAGHPFSLRNFEAPRMVAEKMGVWREMFGDHLPQVNKSAFSDV